MNKLFPGVVNAVTPEELRTELRTIIDLLKRESYLPGVCGRIDQLTELIRYPYTKDFTSLENKVARLEKQLSVYRGLANNVRGLNLYKEAIQESLIEIQEVDDTGMENM